MERYKEREHELQDNTERGKGGKKESGEKRNYERRWREGKQRRREGRKWRKKNS